MIENKHLIRSILQFLIMLFQPTPHSTPLSSQRKTQITNAHHIRDILLRQEHPLRAMLVTEDIPAQSAMMLSLPKRMHQRQKLYVALHIRALLHDIIRDPRSYIPSHPIPAVTRLLRLERIEKQRETELTDVGRRVTVEIKQPSAVIFAVPALADGAEMRRGLQNRLRAHREVAQTFPRFSHRCR